MVRRRNRKSAKKNSKSENLLTLQARFPERSADDAGLKITNYFWKLSLCPDSLTPFSFQI
jgi:hypothetical protein